MNGLEILRRAAAATARKAPPETEVILDGRQLPEPGEGCWRPEPGCVYLTARDVPMPRHPDVLVFGDWHPPAYPHLAGS